MVCVPLPKVFWLAAFAGLNGVAPDGEVQTDLMHLVDLGDQLWHKVAGVRKKKACAFILHDDTEEYFAFLAITGEVMRWLTGWFLFCSAPWYRDSRWSISPICSFTQARCGSAVRDLQYISLLLTAAPSKLRMVFRS